MQKVGVLSVAAVVFFVGLTIAAATVSVLLRPTPAAAISAPAHKSLRDTSVPHPIITVALAGDSLSAGVNRTWPLGDWDTRAWPLYADHGGVDIVAGWATSGADTSEILPHITAYDVDAFVILAGVNDVYFHRLNLADTAGRVQQMGVTSTAPHVFVCALPPVGVAVGDVAGINYVNEQNAAMAVANGWTWIDPFSTVRDGDGYVAGASTDGIHMTEETARIVGEAIRVAVLAALTQK